MRQNAGRIGEGGRKEVSLFVASKCLLSSVWPTGVGGDDCGEGEARWTKSEWVGRLWSLVTGGVANLRDQ